MDSLYGNIKLNPGLGVQFDKIYKSRSEMDENCATDGIFNGRFVFVSYGDDAETADRANVDQSKYGNIYDKTIWQKIWIQTDSTQDCGDKYIMVGSFTVERPIMELVETAPGQQVRVDPKWSNNEHYYIQMPAPWKINGEVDLGSEEGEDPLHDITIVVPKKGIGGGSASIADVISNDSNYVVLETDPEDPDKIYAVRENGNWKREPQIDTKQIVVSLPGLQDLVTDILNYTYPVYSNGTKRDTYIPGSNKTPAIATINVNDTAQANTLIGTLRISKDLLGTPNDAITANTLYGAFNKFNNAGWSNLPGKPGSLSATQVQNSYNNNCN